MQPTSAWSVYQYYLLVLLRLGGSLGATTHVLPQFTPNRDLQVCRASLNLQQGSKLLGLTDHQDPFPQTLKTGVFAFWFVTHEV